MTGAFKFHPIDPRLPVSAPEQIARQVRYAILLGVLRKGDQLPTQRKAAQRLHVSIWSVGQAYRDLERSGVVEPRAGAGTSVTDALGAESRMFYDELGEQLTRWLEQARRVGLSDETIHALYHATFRALGAR